MRKQLQTDVLSFIDETVTVLETFKENKYANLNDKGVLNTLNQHITLLKEEKNKVKNRELIITVVGTMKAGKSTTINSIVGSEILPNRNEAMTSLPTLISHVKGQATPILSFPHVEPVNALIEEIRAAIRVLDEGAKSLDAHFEEKLSGGLNRLLDKTPIANKKPGKIMTGMARVAAKTSTAFATMKNNESAEQRRLEKAEWVKKALDTQERFGEILERIKQGYRFEQTYEGQEAIFDFLKVLNDVVRLTSGLNLTFPYSEYNTIAHLPRIDVEFGTLTHLDENEDRLTLLDTPGPNEAGQDHFKPMLDEQLMRSSAIVVVVDYNQFNSTSENELRQTILRLKHSAQRGGEDIPVYAIVNKFDNVDANSLDKEGVKHRVSQGLFEGTITPDHVLPYSARSAFIANAGLMELEKGEAADKERLASYFNKELWGYIRNNDDEIKRVLEAKRAESLYDEMIDICVIQNYHRVFPQVAKRALHKVFLALEDIKHPVDVLDQSINADAENVKAAILHIEKNLDMIEEERKKMASSLEDILPNAQAQLESHLQKVEEKIVLQWQGYKERNSEFDEKFTSRSDVERRSNILISDAGLELNAIRRGVITDIESQTDSVSGMLVGETKVSLDNFRDKIFKDLLTDGINIESWKPEFITISLSNQTITESGHVIKITQIGEQAKRRTSGVWGGICSWFETEDWGWEDYVRYKDVYSINYDEIFAPFDQAINKLPGELKHVVGEMFDVKIKQSLNGYLNTITDRVEQIKNNMVQSIALNQGDIEAYEHAKHSVNDMKNTVNTALAKIDTLKDAVNTL